MKKAFLGIFAAMVLLSSGATTAFASGHHGGYHCANTMGNRLCDGIGNRCIHADANNDGICDICSSHCGNWGGSNFVDTNNDGICDNANGICAYVDTDNNGFCDLCGTNHENCLAGTGCGRNFVGAGNNEAYNNNTSNSNASSENSAPAAPATGYSVRGHHGSHHSRHRR